MLMVAIISGFLLFATGNAIASASPDIKINEIMFDPMGDDAGSEWIEIYNSGTETQNINGWTISNRGGTTDATLPDWDFPSDTYLVVHFGTGTNDNDFSDGNGSFYTGIDVKVFNNLEDECALYKGSPSASTITDFVSWNFDGDYDPGLAHDYAVSAGIWSDGDYFDILYEPKGYRLVEGDTIGRDKDSTDTNKPEDWYGHGGVDANGPTPGERNLFIPQIFFIEASNSPPKKWTVMFYGVGDDAKLETSIFNDVNEMEEIGTTKDVNLVFQYDGFNKVQEIDGNGKPILGTKGKTWRGYLKKDGNRNIVRCYHLPGDDPRLKEKNMAASKTLSDFVVWAVNKFPADNYALIMNGHGDGWKGLLPDTSDNDIMTMQELKQALANAQAVTGKKINIVGFDACLMAMVEVGYQIKDNGDIMVASEASERGYGWRYNVILKDLKTKTPRQFATAIVNDVPNNPSVDTLSAVDLTAIGPLKTDIDNFAKELKSGMKDYQKHDVSADNIQVLVRKARKKTETFGDVIRHSFLWIWKPVNVDVFAEDMRGIAKKHKVRGDIDYMDLYHFADLIEKENGIPQKYKASAPKIKNQWNNIVFAERHKKKFQNAHGLTIYSPYQERREADDPIEPYQYEDPAPYSATRYDITPGFDFPPATQWDELMDEPNKGMYYPVADAGEDKKAQINEKIEFSGIGSSDYDLVQFAKKGLLKKYHWNFGDGNSYEETWDDKNKNGKRDAGEVNAPDGAFDGKTTHSYGKVGKYTVTLTVTDDEVISKSDTDVVVADVIPEFTTIAIPVTAILGLLFLFSRRKRKV